MGGRRRHLDVDCASTSSGDSGGGRRHLVVASPIAPDHPPWHCGRSGCGTSPTGTAGRRAAGGPARISPVDHWVVARWPRLNSTRRLRRRPCDHQADICHRSDFGTGIGRLALRRERGSASGGRRFGGDHSPDRFRSRRRAGDDLGGAAASAARWSGSRWRSLDAARSTRRPAYRTGRRSTAAWPRRSSAPSDIISPSLCASWSSTTSRPSTTRRDMPTAPGCS